jgi:hypothetical protein
MAGRILATVWAAVSAMVASWAAVWVVSPMAPPSRLP